MNNYQNPPFLLIQIEGNYGVKIQYPQVPQEDREDLSELMQSYRGKFHETHKKYPGWTFFYRVPQEFIGACITALYGFFDIPMPLEHRHFIQNFTETDRVRALVHRDLLKYPPKGDFQLDSIQRGVQSNALIWFLEMGMGKSYISISTLNHRRTHDGVDKILILCPPEGVYNYQAELIRFSVPMITEDDIYIVTPENREPFAPDQTRPVVICTYRRFLMICEDEYKRTRKKSVPESRFIHNPIFDLSKWGTNRALIMDEMHFLRNKESKQTALTFVHAKFFQFRYGLTGTLIPKGPENLWTQMRIIDRYAIGMPFQAYVDEIAFKGNMYSESAITEYKPEGVDKWNRKLSPWIDKKLAKDYLNLPPLVAEKILCEPSARQQELYRGLAQSEFSRIREKAGGTLDVAEVEQVFPYLLLALDDPSLLRGKITGKNKALERMCNNWKFKDHGKIDICESLIEKHVKTLEQKMIVWSGHPSTLDSLAKHFSKYGVKAMHGETVAPYGDQIQFRADVIREFEDPTSDLKILFLSYLAFSTAITLLQAKATIWFDLPTSYEHFAQARKRNHRIGQEDIVTCYDLVFRNSLQEFNYNSLVYGKGLRNELMFKNTDTPLTKEDWRNILTGKYVSKYQ